MIRVQLELGGKDAAYVCDDVDVEGAALDVAEGAFYNAGQSCSATERVYVHRVDLGPVRRRVRRSRERLRGRRSGSGRHRRRPARARRAARRARPPGGRRDGEGRARARRRPSARAAGQLVRADRRRRRRRPHGAHARRVVRVRSSASRWSPTTPRRSRGWTTPSTGSARRCSRATTRAPSRSSRRLDVGNAYWNTADRSTVRLPWAGRRNSGLGVSVSESGIRSFVREKAWHLARP